jgi:gliding motility-associated-like protein
MKNTHPIDNLLKNKLSDFYPEAPPDAWSAIQSGIHHPAASSSVASNNAATAAKTSLTLFTKIILGVAAVSLAGGAFWFMQSRDTTNESKNQEIMINQEKESSSPEAIVKEETSVKTARAPSVVKNIDEAKKEKSSTPKDEVKPKEDLINNTNQKEQNTSADKLAQSQPISQTMQDEPLRKNDEPKNRNAINQPSKSVAQAPKKREIRVMGDTKTAIEVEEEKPIIPNVFTPNADGKNDRFEVQMPSPVIYQLRVVDKDGQEVFASSHMQDTWDGTNKNTGEICEEGRYVYVLIYKYSESGNQNKQTGIIELKR